MSKQSFKEKNLVDVYKTRRKKSKSIALKKCGYDFEKTSKEISSNSYKISGFDTYHLKEKIIYTTKNIEDDVVLSKLDLNIKSIYKIKQNDRHTIVKQIISLLKEGAPKNIYRLDIKNFYESINPEIYANKILQDAIISSESISILKEFLDKTSINKITGLPRGIGLSSTLSEIAMRDFDNIIRSNSKVYYYTRFVDDILIFTTEKIDIKSEIVRILPEGLILNWKKRKFITIDSCYCKSFCKCKTPECKCAQKCSCHKEPDKHDKFSYLGYEFKIPKLSRQKSETKICVDLSNSKYKKIKNRIYLSFKHYEKSGNYKLLENRIKFITGNHYISDKKSRTDQIKAGVYYNYIHITETEKYEKLDNYLRTIISSWKNKKHILNNTHKLALKKYSLVSGFKNKNLGKFSADQINKIKGCWNNG